MPELCIIRIGAPALCFNLILGGWEWQDRFKGQVRFVLPLAPTVNVHELQRHANCASNPMISRFNWVTGHVIMTQNKSTDTEPTRGMESPAMKGGCRSEHFKGEFLGELLTQGQVSIEIWQQFPPYSLYQGCTLCLTTVLPFTFDLVFEIV